MHFAGTSLQLIESSWIRIGVCGIKKVLREAKKRENNWWGYNVLSMADGVDVGDFSEKGSEYPTGPRHTKGISYRGTLK
jgi:hypothetical protein